MPFATAAYYDLLATQRLRQLPRADEDVTLHPAMGVYLTMLGNQKPNAARNIRPDENYARELMQLFTIGLVRARPRRHAAGSMAPASRSRPTTSRSSKGLRTCSRAGPTPARANFAQARARRARTRSQPMQLYPSITRRARSSC